MKLKDTYITHDSDGEQILLDTSSFFAGLIRSNKLRKLQGGKAPIADKTKLRYYLRRLFLDMEFYKSYYPVVYKVKILIPFFAIYRMLRGAVFSGKRLAQEAVMVWKEDR